MNPRSSLVHCLLTLPCITGLLLLAFKGCKCSEALDQTESNYDSQENSLSRRLGDGLTGLWKSRQKRDLLQLSAQIVRSTKFSPLKLAHYGNWCGRGGDRSGDGSYIDGCDLCCKKHDECYRRTRKRYPDCNPRGITYKSRYVKEQDRDYCIDKDCAQKTCQCDVKFILCMQLEPCSPLKVFNSVSYLWWLGVGV